MELGPLAVRPRTYGRLASLQSLTNRRYGHDGHSTVDIVGSELNLVAGL